jgi:hypothetical protein
MGSHLKRYLLRALEGALMAAVGLYVLASFDGLTAWVGAALIVLGTFKVLTLE